MIIGVPRERKPDERRIAITPDGVRKLVRNNNTVLIENNAGALSDFPNQSFEDAGAKIVNSLEEIWGESDLVVKVKEPVAEEIKLFRPGLAVFTFLHLAAFPELAKAMVESEIIGIDYDLVMLEDGRLPILNPMSVIAGKLAVQCGAYSLQSNRGGRGVLLGGCAGVRPARVTILGVGAAGCAAARVAYGMGAEVTVLDIDQQKLMPFADAMPGVRTLYSTPDAIAREAKETDLLIGSVLIPGALAPKIVKREFIAGMRNGAVFVDICIDQGGCAETSKPTTISEPIYTEEGVVHYCVTNMPALVPRSSTLALTNASLPWLAKLAENGIEQTLRTSLPMRRSLVTYKGYLTNERIGEGVHIRPADEAEVNRLLGV